MVAETSQTDAAVQADPGTPAGRAQMREEAIAAAREEMPAESDEQPTADVSGTDEAEANESAEAKGDESPEASEKAPAEEAEPEPEESEDSSTEVDWSNAEQRTAELERLAGEQETNARERLDNQKRSMVGEFNAERERSQAETAQVRQAAMVRELDELREQDPDAFTKRVTDDREAAEALAARHQPVVSAEQLTAIQEQAKLEITKFQAPLMFTALPSIEAAATAGGEEWQKIIDPATGGPFGHIAREKFAEGEEAGVEKFKKSAAYKDEITKAEQRGKQDALAESNLGSPPANDDSTPTEAPATTYDDPVRQAAEDARQEMAKRGKPVSINISDIPEGRRVAAR